MEKNPLFTKERADFVFNKIQNYYKQNAYQLALEEIEANRELTGSVLNIGSQLKLNKIYSDSVVKLMLDAFEVDGNLELYQQLFAQNHTHLELHTDRKTFEQLGKYALEKDANPGYKSKSDHYNQQVPKDDTPFPEEGIIQMCIKTNPKDAKAMDIEKDFFDSIEQPSFHYGSLEENEKVDSAIIKSNVDAKAIHDDFFDSIRPPSVPAKSVEQDLFEQISFSPSELVLPSEQAEPSEESNASHKDFSEPANAKKSADPLKDQLSLFADESSADALRKKIQHLDIQTSDKKPEPVPPPKPSHVVKRYEVEENGQKRTHTLHKSGGKVTEITFDSYEEYANNRPEKSKQKKSSSSQKRSSAKTTTKTAAPTPTKKTNDRSRKNQKSSKREAKKILNYPVVIGLAFLLFILGFVGYKYIGLSKNLSSTPITAEKEKPSTDDNKQQEPVQNPEDQNASDDNNSETEPSADTSGDYVLPSNQRLIVEQDFDGLSKAQLRLAVNEMFARYGWHFGQTGEFYDYFSTKSWYQPDPSMTSTNNAERQFSKIERQNLQLILEKFKLMP